MAEGIQRLLVRWVLEWELIVFQVLHFYIGNTQRRAAQVGDCSCSPSNRVSSEILFLGISLDVKRSHVNPASCRKSPGYFSSCISLGDTQGVQGSYLWAVALQTHSVSTSLRKWRHAKPFPDLASTAWYIHPYSPPDQAAHTQSFLHQQALLPQAEDVPETLLSIQQHRQLFPRTSTKALVPAQILLHYPTWSSQWSQWGRVINIFQYKNLPLIYYLNDVKSEWVIFEAFFLLFPMNNHAW